MRKWLKQQWCSLMHMGGRIKRDDQGRINWQCDTCGMWGDPVPIDDEMRHINRDINAHIKAVKKPLAP